MTPLIEEKEKTIFLIQAGDIFPKGGVTGSPRKKKNQVLSNSLFKCDLGIPFEESWVFAQEVQGSSQDSLTPGIYTSWSKGRKETGTD